MRSMKLTRLCGPCRKEHFAKVYVRVLLLQKRKIPQGSDAEVQLLLSALLQKDSSPDLWALILHTVYESNPVFNARPNTWVSLHGVQTMEGADKSIQQLKTPRKNN
ncbi:hypothetical protein PUN28_009756 [Cardiocondyla obscurior]|uniref:Uncharacterized protein n=1 Tax=Cardiocondyla obscurior TaxID=286306 RepID=A0AAW2FQG8_9HYME